MGPTSVLARFLRYVKVDTRSDESARSSPSTPGQLLLLQQLAAELRAIGAHPVLLDNLGQVTATISSSPSVFGVPAIGFVAHVDTSPELSGENVKPIVHRAWDGGDLVLPDAADAVFTREDPVLAAHVGHDLVTASGATLLGSDDKAGVAEIMAAAEYLIAHPEIKHGPVRIAFTADEEIGRGAARFDIKSFDAVCAYTVDGGEVGDLETESFSANKLTVIFHGFNMHPGYAKGRMINAVRLASAFVDTLPKDSLSPETTEGYEGYLHPFTVDAMVERTTVRLLVRDFATEGLKQKEALVEDIARAIVARQPGARFEVQVEEQYRNMREILDRHPKVVENASEAIRRAGLDVRMRPIRGGTDGSRLSFMGLPTPNLFAGQHNIHSRLEWTSVQDMEKAVEVIVGLCQVWAERS
ncbi:MAG TPA: peptidase T [Vicinamibacterales bacterium]|nr:peptidase T [Vicinamibacterales bacterium]